MNYWIIKNLDGTLASWNIYESKEDCIYEIFNAHPQRYEHYDDFEDFYIFLELVEK